LPYGKEVLERTGGKGENSKLTKSLQRQHQGKLEKSEVQNPTKLGTPVEALEPT